MKRFLSSALILLLAFGAFATPAFAAVPTGYTSKIDYTNTDPSRYKIDIDIVNQVLTVYEKDASGAFTSIVLQGLCTTGNAENPTGAGTFKLGHMKERFGYFVAFGQYAQYWTQVVRGIYIHSVMYDKKNITTMSKSAYNNLGKPLSHGCIRAMPEHAQWIFYNCPPNTACVISKSRPQNAELVAALKAQKPSYKNYTQPKDFKADPPIVPAAINANDTPLRTGFSATRDTTVQVLSANTQVKVLQLAPDWCKVETAKGKLGYVRTKFLTMNPDQLQSVHGEYYAKDVTHLYKSASVNASKLYTYQKGERIEALGAADKNWLTAKVGDQHGYVRISYTQSSPPKIDAVALPKSTSAYIRHDIIANVRTGPGTEYEVIGELNGGAPVELLELEGNWYVVNLGGLSAYINAVCVTFS